MEPSHSPADAVQQPQQPPKMAALLGVERCTIPQRSKVSDSASASTDPGAGLLGALLQYNHSLMHPMAAPPLPAAELQLARVVTDDHRSPPPLVVPRQRRPNSSTWSRGPRLQTFNRYNLFYRLERYLLLHNRGAVVPERERAPDDVAKKFEDLELPPLPPRYEGVDIPELWFAPKSRDRKRSHRKSHGVASFAEVARTVASNWKSIDSETMEYVTDVSNKLKNYVEERDIALAGARKGKANDEGDTRSAVEETNVLAGVCFQPRSVASVPPLKKRKPIDDAPSKAESTDSVPLSKRGKAVDEAPSKAQLAQSMSLPKTDDAWPKEKAAVSKSPATTTEETSLGGCEKSRCANGVDSKSADREAFFARVTEKLAHRMVAKSAAEISKPPAAGPIPLASPLVPGTESLAWQALLGESNKQYLTESAAAHKCAGENSSRAGSIAQQKSSAASGEDGLLRMEALFSAKIAFPLALTHMLESVDELGLAHVVRWSDNETSFVIKDVDVFLADVLPKFFKASEKTKIRSFYRKLNRWGFTMSRKNSNIWRHPEFNRADAVKSLKEALYSTCQDGDAGKWSAAAYECAGEDSTRAGSIAQQKSSAASEEDRLLRTASKVSRMETLFGAAKIAPHIALTHMLESVEELGLAHVVRWSHSETSFVIMDEDAFLADVLPIFFGKSTQIQSFYRKLNRWGFSRSRSRSNSPIILWFHPQFNRTSAVRALKRETVNSQFINTLPLTWHSPGCTAATVAVEPAWGAGETMAESQARERARLAASAGAWEERMAAARDKNRSRPERSLGVIDADGRLR